MKHIILLFAITLLAAPSSFAKEETPAEGMQAIIDLYKQKDFATLIKERYAEIGKAKDETQVQKLIQRFEKRFGSDAGNTKAIEMLTMISKGKLSVEPMSQERSFKATKVAKFDFGQKRPYTLFLLPNGKWAFTL